jgi:hypothetical protein
LPRLPILLSVRSRGGATRILLSALRCAAELALARAYVEADESPQNECERFGAPGRPAGVGDDGDVGDVGDEREGYVYALGVDRSGVRGP